MASELEKKIPGIRERMEEETAYSLKREGLKAGEVEGWEDGYRTRDVPDTFEWWYFDAEFDDGGKSYPEKLDFEWQGEEGKVALSLRNPEMIDSIDMLEGTHWWERPITQLLASPYYYNFNADLELTVDLKGVKATERGRALFELMMQK